MPTDRFPADPVGARAARRFARQALWDLGPVAEVAELLVSELATNVVRHATTPFTVDVNPGDPVRVVVSDGVGVDLQATAAAPDDTSGRGLLILDSLAHRWGVERTDAGKRVWFELRRDAVPWGS
ncbi:MAG TPA: ATP-binding protein [Frankiaceae bacterium]|nr:ATP-binding protein [Frankiaceae bacterium]